MIAAQKDTLFRELLKGLARRRARIVGVLEPDLDEARVSAGALDARADGKGPVGHANAGGREEGQILGCSAADGEGSHALVGRLACWTDGRRREGLHGRGARRGRKGEKGGKRKHGDVCAASGCLARGVSLRGMRKMHLLYRHHTAVLHLFRDATAPRTAGPRCQSSSRRLACQERSWSGVSDGPVAGMCCCAAAKDPFVCSCRRVPLASSEIVQVARWPASPANRTHARS